jgi:hypothetical protein
MATLRVVVASASSLRKVESSFMRNKNDPYVVLIPSWLPDCGDTYRTGHVEDGGASVTFTSEHGSEIMLPLPTDDQMNDDDGDEFTIAVRVLDNNDKKDDVLIGEGRTSGMDDQIMDLIDLEKQHAEENMEVALTFATVSRGRKGKAKSAGSVVLSLFYEPGQEKPKALGKPKQPSRPPPRKPQGGVGEGGNGDDDADSPRVEERAAPGGESKGGDDGNDSRMGETKPRRPPPRPAKANFKPSAPDGADGSGRSVGKPPGRPVRPGRSGGGETKSGRPSAVATKAPTTQADDADGGDMEESSPPSPWQDGLLTVTVLEGIKVRPHCTPRTPLPRPSNPARGTRRSPATLLRTAPPHVDPHDALVAVAAPHTTRLHTASSSGKCFVPHTRPNEPASSHAVPCPRAASSAPSQGPPLVPPRCYIPGVGKFQDRIRYSVPEQSPVLRTHTCSPGMARLIASPSSPLRPPHPPPIQLQTTQTFGKSDPFVKLKVPWMTNFERTVRLYCPPPLAHRVQLFLTVPSLYISPGHAFAPETSLSSVLLSQ